MTKGNCDNLDVANECLGHAQAEIDALKQDNARLRALIKDKEWRRGVCLYCNTYEPDLHDDECPAFTPEGVVK